KFFVESLWSSVPMAIGIPEFVGAQVKIGYVDSETIIQRLPEAQDAQRQLDALVAGWQAELQKMQSEWQRKYEDYDKKKLIMTDRTRAETEGGLMELEKKIANYRNEKFGQNGEMFKKQDELMKPVHDKVFTAIQDVALEEDYDYVFDKSGDILLLYANEEYDLTQEVLSRLQERK
ncbi:MAG: OmpH family outer membrane protein, partial [Bacteroidota bacterium]